MYLEIFLADSCGFLRILADSCGIVGPRPREKSEAQNEAFLLAGS